MYIEWTNTYNLQNIFGGKHFEQILYLFIGPHNYIFIYCKYIWVNENFPYLYYFSTPIYLTIRVYFYIE